jgi:predicted RecB family nuclease
MVITSDLVEAFLKCPTKCFLRSLGETGVGNTYAEWVCAQSTAYQREGTTRLKGAANVECVTGSLDRKQLKSATWRMATESKVCAQDLACTLHAIERVPSDNPGTSAQFIPTRFIFTNKLGRHDKLLLAFDALVLSETLGQEVVLGKITHGEDFVTLKVKTSFLDSDVRGITAKIAALISDKKPPDLVLNRHCPDCEFRDSCRKKAVETDDLSLLAGISEDERNRHRSKGIFTVAQLSYTFRPRRSPKRAKNPARPRYPALQALAIRENTVFVHGSPRLPDSKTQVYLDIEGLPDNESYYLLGALIVTEGQEAFHSFWASDASQEPEIFAQFAEAVANLPDFRVLHFGDYETVALKRMKAKLPESLHPRIDAILERATNVLSVIHPHIYFPTHSNSLKDIGRFLGFERADADATGLQSIIWRKTWNVNRAPDIKAFLLRYNEDDCRTLKQVFESIRGLIAPESTSPTGPRTAFKTKRTEELATNRPYWQLFRVKEYASEDIEKVAKCAYFDYQREKVFLRTHPHFKIINKRRRRFKRTSLRVNKVHAVESQCCPECQSKNIHKGNQMSHDLVDLKFFNGGAKKWVTRTISWRYFCYDKHQFSSVERLPNPRKHGHGLLSWCVYFNVAFGMNMSRVVKSLEDVFGLPFHEDQFYRSKRYIMELYKNLSKEILQSILASPVIHIDETTVRLRKQKGYVWVMTTMDMVYYFYRSSRETNFLQEMLATFSGVLISDFYTGYDSLKCVQQKCLVHFVRDFDDEVLKNPLDMELKGIAREFGVMLREIIETVDRYGLKSRHLRKHKGSVARFQKAVASANYLSPIANQYKKRFLKSGEKMFTFLDHDGVPWNNNNAEHAIKRFAKYRRDADGRFTERSLQEYLVLATVLETCEFNNLNVLKFLLSKEATLEGLLRMAGR